MFPFRTAARRLLESGLRRRARDLPPTDLQGAIVVLAPHPDDETLGCGGVIQRVASSAKSVHVVLMTDGAAARASASSAVDLAALRRGELLAAGQRLGLREEQYQFLHLPDGALSSHLDEATARMVEVLASLRPDVILAPYRFDWHPDHQATARALAGALEAYPNELVVYEYTVWFWHHWPWVNADVRHPTAWMRSAVRSAVSIVLAWRDLRYAMALGPLLEVKRAAFECHASQRSLMSIADGQFMDRVLRPEECFARHIHPADDSGAREPLRHPQDRFEVESDR